MSVGRRRRDYLREEEKQMVVQKRKTKICDKEDMISKLPDPLICDILFHLPTEDAVRTSVLSTRWRNLWHWVPGLDLINFAFSASTALESFVQRFCDSHKDSWIRKLRLGGYFDAKKVTAWVDSVSKRMIQHIDVDLWRAKLPLSIYTCKTLVHLRLIRVMFDVKFVSLPCLKLIYLEYISYPNEATLEKLVSGSPVLEDLTMINSHDDEKVIRLCSQTVKRIHIHHFTVVIDAPQLQCLRTKFNKTKNFKIIHSGFPSKLDISDIFSNTQYSCDILPDISRVRELVISAGFLKDILLYTKMGPVHQFRDLSCLNAGFRKSNLEMLPTILESCPKLESLILKLVNEYEKIEPNVSFTAVPQCLVSSLKFVQYKRFISRYEGEMELVRYFLKNSRILEKFRLDIYDTEKTKCAILQELLAIPRCSSTCEVKVSFGKKSYF